MRFSAGLGNRDKSSSATPQQHPPPKSSFVINYFYYYYNKELRLLLPPGGDLCLSLKKETRETRPHRAAPGRAERRLLRGSKT